MLEKQRKNDIILYKNGKEETKIYFRMSLENKIGEKMTNQKILKIAMEQSARDESCHPDDFKKKENVIVESKPSREARNYLELPFVCNLVSYGNNIVASIQPQTKEIVKEYIERFPCEHCFETPNLHVLDRKMEPLGFNICFMAEYFLPDMEQLCERKAPYPTKVLTQNELAPLYKKEWENALSSKRKEYDRLAVAAFDHGQVVGLAGASADCDTMWQIGIDVLPEYRRQGVASALTSQLALEILSRGMVPFYCAAWSNLKSVRNAIKSGFRPAWVEMTVKSSDFVRKMNRLV